LSAWLPEAARRLRNRHIILFSNGLSLQLASRAGVSRLRRAKEACIANLLRATRLSLQRILRGTAAGSRRAFCLLFCRVHFGPKENALFRPIALPPILLITRMLFLADSSLIRTSGGILEAFRDRQATATWRKIRNFTTLLAALDLCVPENCLLTRHNVSLSFSCTDQHIKLKCVR
jgi:hypothetical protein